MQHNSKLGISAIVASVLVLASSSVWAKPISLIVGAKPIFLHTAPVVDKDEVYVPFTALKAIGASAKEDGDPRNNEQKLKIKPASGHEFSCKARIMSGNPMVPIMDIADELGAVTQWDKVKNTLSIKARLDEVSFDGSKLKLKSSFPLGCTVVQSSWTQIERKLILDIPGLQIPRVADDKVKNATKIPIRLGMSADGETGRVVLDLPFVVKTHNDSPPKTREITISVSPSLKDAPAPKQGATPSEGTIMPGKQPPPPPKPVDIGGISYHARGTNRIDVSISAGAPVKYRTYTLRDPDRFVIDLVNAKLSGDPTEEDIKRSIATRMHMDQFNDETVRMTLDLTRPAAFDIEQDKSGKLSISLELPRKAGGLLAGKVIVVDPGHGGTETGAMANGCCEKFLNLSVAQRVQELLKQAGAIVLMTRKSDTLVALKERPIFANNHSADLFVSIHHNAMGSANKISGTETFFHADDGSSRALANCIQSEVVAANGLPDRGVKSDYIRYPGIGFAVLRGATMPAALTEVAFLDHAGDAACVVDSAFQRKVAEAIVRGIRLYVEGNLGTTVRRPVIKIEGAPEKASKPQAGSVSQSKPSGSLIPKGRVK